MRECRCREQTLEESCSLRYRRVKDDGYMISRRENRIVRVSKNKIIRKDIADGFVTNVENLANTKIIILRIVNIKIEEVSNLNEMSIMEELLNVNQQRVTVTT